MKYQKKFLKLLIFIIVCLLIFWIFKKNNHNNINYTALGDSFALGENAYGQIDYGYSDYVKDYLNTNNKLNKYIKSFSKKDASIESLYQDIALNKKIILNNKEINIKQTLRESNIVTISIGLNDLIYQLCITKDITDTAIDRIISEIEVDFNKLITEIRKYYPGKIYIIGYYNINMESHLYAKAIKKLNNIYQNNKEVIYIDIYELFESTQEYSPNFLNYHPTSQGYEAISKQIITKIEKNLEKK
ncbi:MAG: SGNH/GDSL hydrolase family protein [bacterium]|nr:SGNH/GDSL hydrolase family protein [bacterium]